MLLRFPRSHRLCTWFEFNEVGIPPFCHYMDCSKTNYTFRYTGSVNGTGGTSVMGFLKPLKDDVKHALQRLDM